MGNAYRLVKAMQTAAKPKENSVVDIVVGTVTSVSPLIIKTDKLELTQSFLIVGALCKEFKVNISIPIPNNSTSSEKDETPPENNTTPPQSSSATTASAEVTMWRGLQKGDQVYMIRCCDGQKYYVQQRKEGVK